MKNSTFKFTGFILSLTAMGLLLVNSVHAASTTVTVAAAGMSNILSNFRGSATVTQVILTSPANNTSSVQFVDSVTNILAYTNAAYATTTSYATNVIQCWTNFFGVVNCLTNVGLIDYSNYVAAASVNYPIRISGSAPTNGSFTASGVNYFFNNGVWVTNLGSGTATVTVTYQQ